MLKKIVFCFCTILSFASFAGYADEEVEDNILSCKGCDILAADDDNKEPRAPQHWC